MPTEAELGIVKIRNVGTTVWEDGFDGRRYRIPVGAEVYLPAGAAMTWLGDWNARDDGRNQDRFAEQERLRMRYGAYENDALWGQVKPQLEVYTTDDVRIPCVVDDSLDSAYPLIDLGLDPGAGGAATRLAALEREMTVLKAQLHQDSTLAASTLPTVPEQDSRSSVVEVGVGSEAPTDSPHTPQAPPTVIPRTLNPLDVPTPEAAETITPPIPKDTPSRLPVS